MNAPIAEDARIPQAVERARQATRAAEALLQAGLYRDAVSRADFASHHWIQALFAARGLTATPRRRTFAVLSRAFANPGLLPHAPIWHLAGLHRARQRADEESAIEFSADDARSLLTVATGLAIDAEAILRNEGLIA